MFDPKTHLDLQYYVYLLKNPITKKPFYVGKGKENRVFDHLNQALSDEEATSLKYDTLREIEQSGSHVEHVIVQHGLTEEESYKVETALMDTLNYLGFDLTNLVSGHHALDRGLMTTDEIKRLYNAEKLDALGEDAVLININRKYERNTGPDAIYQATKGIWAIDKNRLIDKESGAFLRKYVLSEYRGLIVEVFEVEEWYQEERGYSSGPKKEGRETRMGMSFAGKVAPNSIRNLYIHKSVAHHKKQGSASAHRFTLGGE